MEKRKNGGLKLLLWIVGLFLFATVIVPQINNLKFFRPLQEVVSKWDINVASFFYTAEISSSDEIKKYTDL